MQVTFFHSKRYFKRYSILTFKIRICYGVNGHVRDITVIYMAICEESCCNQRFKKITIHQSVIIRTSGRPVVKIRPQFIKFLSLNIIEVILSKSIPYLYNHCM